MAYAYQYIPKQRRAKPISAARGIVHGPAILGRRARLAGIKAAQRWPREPSLKSSTGTVGSPGVRAGVLRYGAHQASMQKKWGFRHTVRPAFAARKWPKGSNNRIYARDWRGRFD